MLDDAESALFQIAENGMSNATPELKNVLELYKNNMQKALETKSEVRGLATGFTDLDKATGGWQPGNFIWIRPLRWISLLWRWGQTGRIFPECSTERRKSLFSGT